MPPKRKRRLPGSTFQQWRLYRHLTQQEAAEKADLSIASISQIESSAQGYSKDSLKALARAYDCRIADLFSEPQSLEQEFLRAVRALDPRSQQIALKLVKSLATDSAESAA